MLETATPVALAPPEFVIVYWIGVPAVAGHKVPCDAVPVTAKLGDGAAEPVPEIFTV